jgi:hypothetical protein
MNRQHTVNMSLCPYGLCPKDIVLLAMLCYFSINSSELDAAYSLFEFILPIGDSTSKHYFTIIGTAHDQKNDPLHRLFKIGKFVGI